MKDEKITYYNEGHEEGYNVGREHELDDVKFRINAVLDDDTDNRAEGMRILKEGKKGSLEEALLILIKTIDEEGYVEGYDVGYVDGAFDNGDVDIGS